MLNLPPAAGLAVIAAMPAVAAVSSAEVQIESQIKRVLDDSAAAWSAGDLDRFMACYDRAPGTTYVSGDKLVQGYDDIRLMYGKRFGGGDKAAMGRLSLDIVGFRLLDRDHAYVIGRFRLDRDAAHGGVASGSTTLVFGHTRAGWRIIADHS